MKQLFKPVGFLMLGLAILLPGFTQAQDAEKKDEGYNFTIVKEAKATSVKNQYKSGTCWSFSTIAFLESELIRMGKGEYDLSDMWFVRKAYEEKAEKYVRYHATINFGAGGGSHDILNLWKKYGVVPEEVYTGLNYGESKHDHGELDKVLKNYLKPLTEEDVKKLTTAWLKGFNGILDAYLGKCPETFTYKGKSYTPQSFAKELGINPDDYVEITSYTHHPFYSQFILEVPDNWMQGSVYNVKLEDLKAIVNNAINNGFSIAWGADVSEKGFSWKNGIAVVPDEDKPEIQGTERDKWEKLSEKERLAQLYKFDKPVKEKVITQEMRQTQFDNFQTTDDHGMQIVGIAKDQNGNTFYKVKNSWDIDNKYQGYFYASEPFVLLKTMNVMVHKEAVPKEIRKKLGF